MGGRLHLRCLSKRLGHLFTADNDEERTQESRTLSNTLHDHLSHTLSTDEEASHAEPAPPRRRRNRRRVRSSSPATPATPSQSRLPSAAAPQPIPVPGPIPFEDIMALSPPADSDSSLPDVNDDDFFNSYIAVSVSACMVLVAAAVLMYLQVPQGAFPALAAPVSPGLVGRASSPAPPPAAQQHPPLPSRAAPPPLPEAPTHTAPATYPVPRDTQELPALTTPLFEGPVPRPRTEFPRCTTIGQWMAEVVKQSRLGLPTGDRPILRVAGCDIDDVANKLQDIIADALAAGDATKLLAAERSFIVQ